MSSKSIHRRTVLLAAAGLAASRIASAQAWPTKPIKFINPFPAGGGLDAFARPLAVKVGQQLGQSIVVENISGAGGTVGAAAAARAPGDGYTFMLGAVHHTIVESLYPKLSYNLERDFIPVALIAVVPNVVVVHPRHDFKDLSQLIAHAKSNPGRLNYASAGNGTSHHLAGELFKSITRVQISHVPYRGAAPALQDLVAGQVDLMFDGLALSTPQIKAGKIRPLAVTSRKRSPAFPQIPTAEEAGVPGFEVTTWYALWAVKGTPKPIVQRMSDEVGRALALPELKDIWTNQSAEAGTLNSEQLAAFQKTEIAKWSKVVREGGVKLD